MPAKDWTYYEAMVGWINDKSPYAVIIGFDVKNFGLGANIYVFGPDGSVYTSQYLLAVGSSWAVWSTPKPMLVPRGYTVTTTNANKFNLQIVLCRNFDVAMRFFT